ncbi:uncharacterized protein LOC108959566 [Eucalyptus grandis]|uniref:uncharacterized protein LOC108959566 n=1 Tax=Eucalyptus grandis TaxID=71139 RepID=UPI0008A0F595|nr:uncharacterized protein LOC108959566 [Eucalyptus grandis]
MGFEKKDLDVVLIPVGLLIMFLYHLQLLYRYLHQPHSTVMGFENFNKLFWVRAIMQSEKREIGTCLGVISSNISAATFLASVSLTLCSLIGAWISNTNNNFFESELIYGDTRSTTLSIKYISLLICFLLAFTCFIQSARHFVHANYLISMPSLSIPPKSVEVAVIRGGDFWSVGLRALYFAMNLLLWFFGPIPMFAGSIFMVLFLHYLDSNTMPLIEHEFEFDGGQVVRKVEQRVSDIAMAIHMPSHQN